MPHDHDHDTDGNMCRAGATNTAIVPRPPLNAYLKLTVVRQPTDVVRCQDPERPGQTKSLLVAVPITTDSSVPSRPPAKVEQRCHIPVPTITQVSEYLRDVPPTYAVPPSYIRHGRTWYEELESAVEYNLDEEDESWWRDNRSFGPLAEPTIVDRDSEAEQQTTQSHCDDQKRDMPLAIQQVSHTNPLYLHAHCTTPSLLRQYQPRLPLALLEQIMDALEKATAFEAIVRREDAITLLVNKFPVLEEIFGTLHPEKQLPDSPLTTAKQPLSTKREIDRNSEWNSGGNCTKSKQGDTNKRNHSIVTTPTNTLSAATTATAMYMSTNNRHGIPFLAPPITLSQVLSQIHAYWIQKRCKLKKPLLRRYWPVTSTSDLNPHMVFRPREKEKRKLRKKRQNDWEAYKKMRALKIAFEKVRVLCELVERRELVSALMMELSNEYFWERMHEWMDTSSLPRKQQCLVLEKTTIEELLLREVPKYFEDGPILKVSRGGGGGSKKQRKRASVLLSMEGGYFQDNVDSQNQALGGMGSSASSCSSVTPGPWETANSIDAVTSASLEPVLIPQPLNTVLVAGHDGGLPAPSFLHPLASRDSNFVTNWEDAVPFVPYYENGKQSYTLERFRHRPRLGRGGRIVVDRVPYLTSSHHPPPKVVIYGSGMSPSGYHTCPLGADSLPTTNIWSMGEGEFHKANARGAPTVPPAECLQDLLPKALGNPVLLAQKIEEICARGLVEDCNEMTDVGSEVSGSGSEGMVEEMEEILVPIEDWMEAPNGFYGREQFVIGPL